MCGVVGGFVDPDKLARMLSNIQHRGFMSAGIATNHWWWVSDGTVADLCREHKDNWVGDFGIGHVRYCTDKSSSIQPVVDLKNRCALAFNGQVQGGDTARLFKALQHPGGLKGVKGAYSFAYLDADAGLIKAGRDPQGFHPLYYSKNKKVVASETCADLSITDWRPVPPGEVINVEFGHRMDRTNSSRRARCFFEYVYFSSVQSEFDALGVWSARRTLGQILAGREDVEADIVVPVPDSGIAAAQAMAEELKIPLRSAIYRDRYAERTFINERGQDSKYRLIPDALHGKILLVDDSIVRGHTLNCLVPKLKQYVDEVHVRVTCPKITHACKYGINITEAGAHGIPAADSVRFLETDDVDIFPGGMCRACVTGEYPC